MSRRTVRPVCRAIGVLLAVTACMASCSSEESDTKPSESGGSSGADATSGKGGISSGTGGSATGGGLGGAAAMSGTGSTAGAGSDGGASSGGASSGGASSDGGSSSGGASGAAPAGGSSGKGGMPPVPPNTIAGFGVNGQPRNWGTDGRAVKPALDLLVNDLGANLFRVEIYHGASDWELSNDDSDPDNFAWSAYDTIFQGKRFTDLWNYIRYLNGLGVTEIELAAHGLVPSWLGSTSVSQAMEGEYIETLVAVLLYATTRAPEPRPRFTMFSPWNETDIGPPEGISLAADRGVPLLRRLIARMAEFPELSGIQIVSPETSNENAAAQWRGELLDDPVIAGKLRAVAYHRYGGYATAQDWHDADPPMWLSEFNDWGGYCYVVQWNHAMNLAGNLLGALQSGVKAGMVWTDYDAPHIHDGDQWETFGLLAASYQGSSNLCSTFSSPPSTQQLDALTYAPKPTFHALKHVAAFIQRGATFVETSDDRDGTNVVGFQNPDGSTVVFGTNAGGDGSAQITFDNAGDAPTSMIPYVSTAGSYVVEGARLTLDGATVTIALRDASVFTLVAE